MPFLQPNQQRQSTEGKCCGHKTANINGKQKGQRPMTGQRAANFRQDLEAT